MLTSNPSNQYLRPDYLSPLPSTLDAKNSPLALLAQTCSAIGADSPNPKLLANIEKSAKLNNKFSSSSSTDGRDKLSPYSNQSSLSASSLDQVKSSFKPYEPQVTVREHMNMTPAADEQHSSILESTYQNNNNNNNSNNSNSNSNSNNNNNNNNNNNINNNNNNNNINNKNNNINSNCNNISKTSKINGTDNLQRCDSNQSATSQNRDSSPAIISNSNSSRKTPVHHHNNESHSPKNQQQRIASKESHDNARLSNELSKEHSNSLTIKTSSESSVPATSSSYSFPGYSSGIQSNYSMDLMTASGLMSPHHQMLKAAALSPYFSYSRMKGMDPNAAAAAAGMMGPICRDPYCTGCPMNPHIMNKAAGQPCPPGCMQCDPSSNASKSYQQHNNAAAAYAHAQLAALAAASQLPYVCSWIAGDSAYCGKRFGTSDELFQHLRTHTANMSESMLNAVAATGLPPNHPLFQRAFPTSAMSPLTASMRYHPYNKPSMLPPSLTGPPPPGLSALSMPPHPSLAQYFSPYSLYGSRLGASPSMHP